jgi:hypothetical protein
LKKIILLVLICTISFAKPTFRKYNHVKKFYQNITKETIQLGIKYNIPPSAILAIAGLESGFGSGYVSKITANILSLGARKGERELPALRVAVDKNNNVILNTKNLAPRELVYKNRPPSLKKDYRPSDIAGTKTNLDFFEKNKNLKKIAMLKNIEDFMSSWISTKTKVKAFKDARLYMDNLVKKNGKDVLFDYDTNVKFINLIGGKPRSFNYRKSWVVKSIKILDKTGINDITKAIYFDKKDFNDAWQQ